MNNYKEGTCAYLFLICYGIFRIISEQFREPDKHIGYVIESLSMGSILSSVMIIFGFIFLSKIILNEKNR